MTANVITTLDELALKVTVLAAASHVPPVTVGVLVKSDMAPLSVRFTVSGPLTDPVRLTVTTTAAPPSAPLDAVTVTVDVSSETVTVGFATADGSALAGSDYANTSGTVTFAPGEQTKTVSIPVVGDTKSEPDENFTVRLLSPSNATIADGEGVVTITNDDADTTAPRVSGLKLSKRSFRAKKGATVRYRLSEAARTKFTVQRCLRPRCTKFKRVRGSLTRTGRRGANSFKFKGRVGRRTLGPGSYRLTAVPKDAAGNVGRPARASFKIKR